MDISLDNNYIFPVVGQEMLKDDSLLIHNVQIRSVPIKYGDQMKSKIMNGP